MSILLRIALHLLFVVGLWFFVRRRPAAPLPLLLLGAWVGLLLGRVAPGFLAVGLDSVGLVSTQAPLLAAGIGFLGSLILLWVVFNLTNRGRDETRRRTRVFRRIFVGALVFSAFIGPSGMAPILFIFCSPWIGGVRWANNLGARALLAGSVTALAGVLLSIVNFDNGLGETENPLLVAMTGATSTAQIFFGVHSLTSFFALPGRIHLAIKSIGRRLTASHLLAGLVPTALAVLFVLLSASVQLSNYRGTLGARFFHEAADGAREKLLAHLIVHGAPPTALFDDGHGEVVIERLPGERARFLRGSLPFSADSLLDRDESSVEAPLLWSGRATYLRARVDTTIAGRTYLVEALAPLDAPRLNTLARLIGVPVRPVPNMVLTQSGGGVQINTGDHDDEDETDSGVAGDSSALAEELRLARTIVDSLRASDPTGAGRIATAASDEINDLVEEQIELARVRRAEQLRRESGDTLSADADSGRDAKAESLVTIQAGVDGWRVPGGGVVSCLRWRGDRFTIDRVPISTFAGFGESFFSLFQVRPDNPIALIAMIALAAIAVLLLGAVYATVTMVLGMVRQVTRTVEVLKKATAEIGSGNLEHRVAMEGRDELWDVAASLNQMASGLQQLQSMERENARLEDELRLARVIQDRLLPSGPPTIAHYDVAGTSLPARQVGGDYFDYLMLEGGLVGIAVADVSGKGAAAALLMSSFRASLYSIDLATLGPAESLVRLNRFIHASVDPGKFITAFLGVLDPSTGVLKYSCAGHEPPIVVSPAGEIAHLTAGGLVLGLFPSAVYEEEAVRMPTGSLLAVFTDGVTEAQSPSGEFYGDERLIDVLQKAGSDSSAITVAVIMRELQVFAGVAAQYDDITLVLARRT